MRIAVFGAGGQVGRALLRVAKARGIDASAITRADADVTDAQAVTAALHRTSADVVINAAAYTAVDKAEAEPDLATKVNADGAANVAAAAERIGIPLIQLSTDYVFDGRKRTPYTEDDEASPLNVYGRSKRRGEEAAQRACKRTIILRTAWVYGLEGENFVKTMLRLAAEQGVVRVVDDQRGCPTFADDLAHAIISIAGRLSEQWGIYHLAGSGEATRLVFAKAIFARAGITPRIEPVGLTDYPSPARRPANSALDCTKAKRAFAVELPPWNDGLSRMLHAHLGAR